MKNINRYILKEVISFYKTSKEEVKDKINNFNFNSTSSLYFLARYLDRNFIYK